MAEATRSIFDRRTGVSALARASSALLIGYVRHAPLERGKWRLLRSAKSFLVAKLDDGLLIRVGGLTHVETELIRRGAFEPETVRLFASLLEPGMTVFDVGANIGVYTLTAARGVGPNGQVHAFEPTPSTVETLERNVALNALNNVVMNPVAASNAVGMVTLYCDIEDHGQNSIASVQCVDAGGRPGISVPSVTLDHYVAQRGIRSVDMIKLDVEGAELMVLEGAQALLAGPNAPVVITELNARSLRASGSRVSAVVTFLEELGYNLRSIATYGTNTHDPWTNAIATKPSHIDRFDKLKCCDLKPLAQCPALTI